MINKEQEIDEILSDNGLDGTPYFTNPSFVTAIIGYTDDGRIVYDYNAMIDYMVKYENCDEMEAGEWIDYNTIRTIPYMGAKAPVIVYPLLFS